MQRISRPTNSTDLTAKTTQNTPLFRKLTEISDKFSLELNDALKDLREAINSKPINEVIKIFLEIKNIISNKDKELADTLNVAVNGTIEHNGKRLVVHMYSISFIPKTSEVTESLERVSIFPQILDQNLRSKVILDCSYRKIDLTHLKPELRLPFAFHLAELESAIYRDKVNFIDSVLKKLYEINHPKFKVSTTIDQNSKLKHVVISCSQWSIKTPANKEMANHILTVCIALGKIVLDTTASIPHVAIIITHDDYNPLKTLWNNLNTALNQTDLTIDKIIPLLTELAIIARSNGLKFDTTCNTRERLPGNYHQITLTLDSFPQIRSAIFDPNNLVPNLMIAFSSLAEPNLDKLMSEFKKQNVLQLYQPNADLSKDKEIISFIAATEILKMKNGVALIDSGNESIIVTFVQDDKDDRLYQITQLDPSVSEDLLPQLSRAKSIFISVLEEEISPVFILKEPFKPGLTIEKFKEICNAFKLIFEYDKYGWSKAPADIGVIIYYATLRLVQKNAALIALAMPSYMKLRQPQN